MEWVDKAKPAKNKKAKVSKYGAAVSASFSNLFEEYTGILYMTYTCIIIFANSHNRMTMMWYI